MIATIAATVMPDHPIPYLQVDMTADTPATIIGWEVARDAGAELVAIRRGRAFSGALSFEDHTAPLGVPVAYKFTVRRTGGTAESATSDPVTITGTLGCWLTDPFSGRTIGVSLVSWPERTYADRRAILEVLDRPDPVVLSDVHTWPAGVWTFYTATDPDTAALVTLLAGAAGIVRLRTQPGSSIPTCYASTGRVIERRYTGSGGDPRRFVLADLQEIAPIPDTGETLHATLQGLADLVPTTLADLAELRPTLRQLSMIRTETAP